jgi:hypothetical protein
MEVDKPSFSPVGHNFINCYAILQWKNLPPKLSDFGSKFVGNECKGTSFIAPQGEDQPQKSVK